MQDLPNRADPHRQRGFTLIEVLIAITIAGFVLASLATVTRILGRNWTANTESLLRQDMFLRGLTVVSRDIHGMLRLQFDTEDGNKQRAGFTIGASKEQRKTTSERYAFAGTSSRMELAVVEPPYPTKPGVYFVRYRVVPEKDGFALLRERAPYRIGTTSIEKLDYGEAVILLEGRYRYSFSYAAEGRDELTWSDNWTEPGEMPKAVRLVVASLDTGQPVIAPFSVRPRIDAEHDCLKPKSQKCSVAVTETDGDEPADGSNPAATSGSPGTTNDGGASTGNDGGQTR